MLGHVRNESIHDPDAATAKQHYRMSQLLFECSFLNGLDDESNPIKVLEINVDCTKQEATTYISTLLGIRNALRIDWIQSNPNETPPWLMEGQIVEQN